ncbi:hypothetical protein [Siphonobacter aquaeclarae]|nr:hypothetical protein [Siphonobacter aquaeclarae]
MKKIIKIFLLFLVVFSCKKREESDIVQGQYLADYWSNSHPYSSYPINGLTISMQVSLVDNSKASVTIDAPRNDQYSPGIDKKVFTVPVKNRSSGVYELDLNTTAPDSTESWMTIYPNGTADYVFTPPNYHKGNVNVRMKKIHQ